MTTYKIAHTNEVKEIVWICLSVVVIAIGVIGYVSYHIIRLRSESKPDREDEAQEVECSEINDGNDKKIDVSSPSSLTVEDEEDAKQYDAQTDIDNEFGVDVQSMYREIYTFEDRPADKYRSERETFDDDSVHSTTTDRYSVSGKSQNEKDEINMLHSETASTVNSEIETDEVSTVQSEIKKDRESTERVR